jgi:parallel beta-helix repeat protein
MRVGGGARVSIGTRRGISGRVAAATVCALLLAAVVLGLTAGAMAAVCGGSIPCQCGDTVGSNYLMTADLGPCPRLSVGDTVGLRVRPGVTLDCQDHRITGPGDLLKDSFGIRVGTSSGASNMTVRRCDVSRFWWGIHVDSATDVRIDSNHLHDNGWKDPEANGNGYGLDVANSSAVTVRNNRIVDNGNEGFHLSSSSGSIVEDNVFEDNGREQLYLIHTDSNVIRRNRATGGTQGLEMRFSSGNAFSYNVWAGSPLQYLENDNHDNTFLYERFEGRVAVGDACTGNRFESSSFSNPAGNCMTVTSPSTAYVFKSFFAPCNWDVVGNALVTLDRSVNTLAKVSKTVTVRFPGCTADFDLDGSVTTADRPTILAAMDSVIGGPNWEPEADLDHDGDVDAADLAIFDAQSGPCAAADLAVTALSNPPAVAVPGTPISITDTVRNQSGFAAGTSRTQYYFSVDALKNTGDKLLGGRSVPALVPGGESTATVTVTIPANTLPGSYFLLACADDTGLLLESNEVDNCRASTTKVQVGRPDLVMTALGNPPTAVALGGNFPVTDTVKNDSLYPAAASRVQYYLSLDTIKGTTDKLLSGARVVPILAGGATSPGGITVVVTVVVPNNTPPGSYFLMACADDTRQVVESDENNNCRSSTGKVEVGRPDLMSKAVSEPPANKVRGTSFSVADTVENPTAFNAGPSRVQYYLSLDEVKNAGDRLLTGFRSVTALAAHTVSTGTMSVTIPSGTTPASYFLLACADDAGQVIESVETNNCLASIGKVTVTVGP